MAIKDVVSTATARISNPILGNYFFTLCLLNWRLWFYTFSGNATIEWRISSIEEYIHSSGFKLSFLFSIIILAFYLYVLPFILLLIKTLQNKVEVFQSRKEMELEDRLRYEKTYGGHAEILATGLKRLNFKLVDVMKYNDDFVSTNLQVPIHTGIQNEYSEMRRKSKSLIEESEKLLSYMDDIFKSNYGPSDIELAQRFKEKRNRKWS